MENNKPDWYRHLSSGPFRSNSFTDRHKRMVLERVFDRSRPHASVWKRWSFAVAIIALVALIPITKGQWQPLLKKQALNSTGPIIQTPPDSTSGPGLQKPPESSVKLAEQRNAVFRLGEYEFSDPHDGPRRVTSGEWVQGTSDESNIVLLSVDKKGQRLLFDNKDFEDMRQKVIEASKGLGENKKILYWAVDPFPADGSNRIVYETNKDTILTSPQGAFSIHIVDLDGKNDRILIDGTKYGDLQILDTFDEKVIAHTDNALLVTNTSTGKVKEYALHAHYDGISTDGSYALFRKIDPSTRLVQPELFMINVDTGDQQQIGTADTNYYFNHGVK